MLKLTEEQKELVRDFIEIGRTFVEFLKDHTLYYLHNGIYYNYETGEEMV